MFKKFARFSWVIKFFISRGRITPPPLGYVPGVGNPDHLTDPIAFSLIDRYNAFDCLKHLEYSDIIVMVVDVHGFQLGPNEPLRWGDKTKKIENCARIGRELNPRDKTKSY